MSCSPLRARRGRPSPSDAISARCPSNSRLVRSPWARLRLSSTIRMRATGPPPRTSRLRAARRAAPGQLDHEPRAARRAAAPPGIRRRAPGPARGPPRARSRCPAPRAPIEPDERRPDLLPLAGGDAGAAVLHLDPGQRRRASRAAGSPPPVAAVPEGVVQQVEQDLGERVRVHRREHASRPARCGAAPPPPRPAARTARRSPAPAAPAGGAHGCTSVPPPLGAGILEHVLDQVCQPAGLLHDHTPSAWRRSSSPATRPSSSVSA